MHRAPLRLNSQTNGFHVEVTRLEAKAQTQSKHLRDDSVSSRQYATHASSRPTTSTAVPKPQIFVEHCCKNKKHISINRHICDYKRRLQNVKISAQAETNLGPARPLVLHFAHDNVLSRVYTHT